MRLNGNSLNENEIKKVCLLLADTDLTIQLIARRMNSSPSIITGINRKYRVRKYEGKKVTWTNIKDGTKRDGGI